jgi:methylase of polypeptide subunit release factors
VGTGFHREIAAAAKTRFVVFEVGDGQARDVAQVLRETGYRGIAITPDFAGVERVVEARR